MVTVPSAVTVESFTKANTRLPYKLLSPSLLTPIKLLAILAPIAPAAAPAAADTAPTKLVILASLTASTLTLPARANNVPSSA